MMITMIMKHKEESRNISNEIKTTMDNDGFHVVLMMLTMMVVTMIVFLLMTIIMMTTMLQSKATEHCSNFEAGK